MSYSKKQAARSLGISRKEFENRAKAAGFDSTEGYYNHIGGAAAPIMEAIEKEIIALDRQLDALGPLALTDEEKEIYLQKAITEIQPYYDSRRTEIEAGIQEGKVRTAEDNIMLIREVEEETKGLLANYDLSTARTEEEFANRMGALTSRTEDEIERKTYDWRQRIEGEKFTQIRKGIFSSGIGKKKRLETEAGKTMELGATERRSAEEATSLETGQKYDLDRIKLARQSAQEGRVRRIGAPVETAATREAARGTLGLGEGEQLGSQAEITSARTERGISPIHNKYALTELERGRLEDVESTKLEFEAGEKSLRNVEYEQQRRKILADKASKQSALQRYY